MEHKYGTFGRPVSEGNGPLEMFDEFCIRQYFRIRDGVVRKHEDPAVPRLVEREDGVLTTPKSDPDEYEIEVRR